MLTLQNVVVLLALCLVGLAMFYTLKGAQLSGQPWLPWIAKASLAAGVVYAVGMRLLGLPGAIFVGAVTGLGLKPPADTAWPLAIWITQVGALMVAPASIVLRLAMPDVVGWRHARATAVLTIVATFLLALLSTITFIALCSMPCSGC
jgi:hypothetical protein